MFLLFILIILPVFIIFAVGIRLLGNMLLAGSIRTELNQRGYKLISIKTSKEKFEPPKPSVPSSASFRQYMEAEHGFTVGGVKGRPNKITLFKEVLFSIPGDKTIKTLVSARLFLFIPYKIHFKINLDDLK